MKRFMLVITMLLSTGCATMMQPQSAQATVFVVSSDGSWVAKSSLPAAAIASDAAGKRIVVTGHETLTAPLIWPSDRTLTFENGGYVTWSGSNILGWADGSSIDYLRPEWFGAVGNGNPATMGGADDGAAFRRCIASAENINGEGYAIPIQLYGKNYNIDAAMDSTTGAYDGLVFNKGGEWRFKIIGDGGNATLIFRQGSAPTIADKGVLFRFEDVPYVSYGSSYLQGIYLENMTLFGTYTGSGSTSSDTGIKFGQAAAIIMKNVIVSGFGTGVALQNAVGVTSYNLHIKACKTGYSETWGIGGGTGNDDVINNHYSIAIDPCDYACIHIKGTRQTAFHGGSISGTYDGGYGVFIEAPAAAGTGTFSVTFDKVYFDIASYTAPIIQIGAGVDNSAGGINGVYLTGCYFSCLGTYTGKPILVQSSTLANLTVTGLRMDYNPVYFVYLDTTANPSLDLYLKSNTGGLSGDLGGILDYRVFDARSATYRTELFKSLPSMLTLNPDTRIFPNKNSAFDFNLSPTDIQETTAVVTAGSAIKLPQGTPAPSVQWYPHPGGIVTKITGDAINYYNGIEGGSELVFEWIVKAGGGGGASMMALTIANSDGTGGTTSLVTWASLIQTFTTGNTAGYKRYIAKYIVPAGKALFIATLNGSTTEDRYVDYFAVHGPDKYKTLSREIVMIVDNADSSITNFTNSTGNTTVMYNTTLTGNRTVALTTSSITEGARVRVVRNSATPGSFTLAVVSLKTIPSGTNAFVDLLYTNNAWKYVGYGLL